VVVQNAITLGGETRSSWPADSSTTNLNMGGNGVTNASFLSFATNISAAAWTGAVPALYYKTNSLVRLTPDSYTKLLLHMDGANNSTNFVDDSVSNWVTESVGDARQSTMNPRFGTACAYFDGVGDYVRVTNGAAESLNFSTNDFAVEMFVMAQNKQCCFFDKDYGGVCCYEDGLGGIRFRVGHSELTATYNLVNGTWTHLAFTRESGTARIFVNGQLLAEGSGGGFASSISNWYGYVIGARWSAGGMRLVGYVDEVRVSIGIARYTGSFPPPTAPFNTTGTVAGLYFNDGVAERRVQLVDP
jgi:hypothetical protein